MDLTVMEIKKNGADYYTKYYASKLFEEKVNTYGNSSYYNYVYVQGELMGINIQGNINEAYYVHTDYLGSVVALTKVVLLPKSMLTMRVQ